MSVSESVSYITLPSTLTRVRLSSSLAAAQLEGFWSAVEMANPAFSFLSVKLWKVWSLSYTVLDKAVFFTTLTPPGKKTSRSNRFAYGSNIMTPCPYLVEAIYFITRLSPLITSFIRSSLSSSLSKAFDCHHLERFCMRKLIIDNIGNVRETMVSLTSQLDGIPRDFPCSQSAHEGNDVQSRPFLLF